MAEDRENPKERRPGRSFWQIVDLSDKRWYIWLPIFFFLTSLADEPLKALGINRYIAWVAGVLIVFIVVVVVAKLAAEDALERGSSEEDYLGKLEAAVALESHDLPTTKASTFGSDVSQGLVLVDFWASWCDPCRKMHPVLKDPAEDIPELEVFLLDVEQEES